MRNSQEALLDEQEYAHQHKLCQRIGGIDLRKCPVPGLPIPVLLPENKTAVQQIGNQHSDYKGNQITYWRRDGGSF